MVDTVKSVISPNSQDYGNEFDLYQDGKLKNEHLKPVNDSKPPFPAISHTCKDKTFQKEIDESWPVRTSRHIFLIIFDNGLNVNFGHKKYSNHGPLLNI